MKHIPFSSKDPTYKVISERLMNFNPGIDLGKHIAHDTKKAKDKLEIGPTTSEGISFVPRDPIALRMEIVAARNKSGLSVFHYDDRKIWIFRLAAVATHGGGYREIGSPSLHCAIASDVCNIHLDDFGFVSIGSDGKTYFTPDALPHIADELIYRAYIRKYVRKALVAGLGEKIAAPAALLLDQSYLALPTLSKLNMSKLTNKIDKRIGMGVKIAETDAIKLRFESTCGNANCSDNRNMFTLDIDLDKLVNTFAK
jgi:hypothetical protein